MDVIIPSFNQQEFLPDAIESCLNQSKKPSRVIIVDDGSTDGSLEIARKYMLDSKWHNDPVITVVSQVNKGLASARNTGIMHSNAGYVVFLDADDMLKDDYIKRVSEVANKTDADIIAPSFKCFGVSQNEILLMENPKMKDFVTNGKPTNRIGYCAAVKRKALLDVGGYSPRMTWGAEDLHLWINLLSRGKKLVTLQEVLWLYRTKKESMWTDTAKHVDEFMAQIKKDFPKINENW